MTKIYLLAFALFLSLFLSSFGNEEEKNDYDHLSTPRAMQASVLDRTTTLDSNDIINKDCDCGPNGDCSYKYGIKICKCDNGYAEKDGICEECNCGGRWNSICYFENIFNTRKCQCGYGYAVKKKTSYPYDESCEKCVCAVNEKCEFINNSKNCSCEEEYSRLEGKCERCDCGGKSKKCYFSPYLGTRKCECEQGYGVKVEISFTFRYQETCVECDCGKNASCEFNGVGIHATKTCLCDPGFEEVDGKCQDASCDCGDHGNCSFIKGKKTCSCDPGYKEYDGKCQACDCGKNGTCIILFGEKKCYCNPGYVEYERGCSKNCECGPGTESCSIDYMGKKRCSCKDGYVARTKSYLDGEYCEACYCGENQKCEMVFGEKRCFCSNFLKEINGKCQECDCGANSVSCKLDYLKSKICECKQGFYAKRPYAFQDDQCLDCDCGDQADSCYFSTYGSKICRCVYGMVKENATGRCKECDCGIGQSSCIFTWFGKRKCTCISGYVAQDSSYINGETCVYEFTSNHGSKTTGWRIATYVVSVFIVVIIIGMLIVIADKQVFRSNRNRPRQ